MFSTASVAAWTRSKAPSMVGGRRLRMCESAFWHLTRDTLCGYMDLTADQAKDNTGERCNAMSFSLQFETAPVKLGVVRVRKVPANLCL
jgi:hypothetical protein